jgi:hypothetical protein
VEEFLAFLSRSTSSTPIVLLMPEATHVTLEAFLKIIEELSPILENLDLYSVMGRNPRWRAASGSSVRSDGSVRLGRFCSGLVYVAYNKILKRVCIMLHIPALMFYGLIDDPKAERALDGFNTAM